MTEGRVKPEPMATWLEAKWSPERRERALLRTHARRAARARATRAVGVLGAVLVVLGLGFSWHAFRAPSPLRVSRSESGMSKRIGLQAQSDSAIAVLDRREVRFGDGSLVHLLDQAAALDVGAASPQMVLVTLRGGSAEFLITHNPARQFVIQAGPAQISVLGTHFRVTRDAERVRVEVLHGRVAVACAGRSRLLTDGESNWFPETELGVSEVAAASQSVSASAPSVVGSGVAPLSSALPAASSARDVPRERSQFLEHAKHGEYLEAYSVLQRAPELIGSNASDLLLAADAARFSGHPAEAVLFLTRVTREHARESVAPLAAFTLGRIYLSQLKQPGNAADAFALSRRLAPSGSLAEDALAHEVEAAAQLGDSARAHTLAQRYAADYPDSRRLPNLRKAGGLE